MSFKGKNIDRRLGLIVSWGTGVSDNKAEKEIASYTPKQKAVLGMIHAVDDYVKDEASHIDMIARGEKRLKANRLKFLVRFGKESMVLRRFFSNDQEYGEQLKEIFEECGLEYTRLKALRMREAGLFLAQMHEEGIDHKFNGEGQVRDFLSVTKNTDQDCNDGMRVDYSECVDAAKKLNKFSKNIPVKKSDGTWKSSGEIKKVLIENKIGEPSKLKAAAAKQEKKTVSKVERLIQLAEKLTDVEWEEFCEKMGVVQDN